MLAAYEGHGF